MFDVDLHEWIASKTLEIMLMMMIIVILIIIATIIITIVTASRSGKLLPSRGILI